MSQYYNHRQKGRQKKNRRKNRMAKNRNQRKRRQQQQQQERRKRELEKQQQLLEVEQESNNSTLEQQQQQQQDPSSTLLNDEDNGTLETMPVESSSSSNDCTEEEHVENGRLEDDHVEEEGDVTPEEEEEEEGAQDVENAQVDNAEARHGNHEAIEIESEYDEEAAEEHSDATEDRLENDNGQSVEVKQIEQQESDVLEEPGTREDNSEAMPLGQVEADNGDAVNVFDKETDIAEDSDNVSASDDDGESDDESDIVLPVVDEVYLEEGENVDILSLTRAGSRIVTSSLQQEDLEKFIVQHPSDSSEHLHVKEAHRLYAKDFKILQRHMFQYKQIGVNGEIMNPPYRPRSYRLSWNSSLQSQTVAIPELDSNTYTEVEDDLETDVTDFTMISPRFSHMDEMSSTSMTTPPNAKSFRRRADSLSITPGQDPYSDADLWKDDTPKSVVSVSSAAGSSKTMKRSGTLLGFRRRRKRSQLSGSGDKGISPAMRSTPGVSADNGEPVEGREKDRKDYLHKFRKFKEKLCLGHAKRLQEKATTEEGEGAQCADTDERPSIVPSRRLLSMHDPEYKWVDVASRLCNRKERYDYPDTPHPLQFAFEPKGIRFTHSFPEPLFGRVAIYDASAQRKVTDDFHFFASDSDTLRMLPDDLADEVAKAKSKCIFSISEPTSSMYLVLFVDRIPTYSLKDALKTHSKTLDKKDQGKIVQSFFDRFTKMGHFRQPFVWSYAPLFHKRELQTGVRTIDSLYGVHGNNGNVLDIYKSIKTGSQDSSRAKRQGNVLQATFSFEVTQRSRKFVKVRDMGDFLELGPMLSPRNRRSLQLQHGRRGSTDDSDPRTSDVGAGSYNPSSLNNDLQILSFVDNDPWAHDSEWRMSDGGRGMSVASESEAFGLDSELTTDDDKWDGRPSLCFGSMDDEDQIDESFHHVSEFSNAIVRTPHVKYVNSLYVYPEIVNFQDLSKVRNITVEVMLRRDDKEVIHLEGVECIPSRFDPSSRHSAVSTAVQYHEKAPQLFDEIKIDLPPDLRPSDHLFFKFYNLRIEDTEQSKVGRQLRKLLGYAFLPLYHIARGSSSKSNASVFEGTHKLPVVKELRPFYTEPKMEGRLKTSGKSKFQFSTRLISTVYPKDDSLLKLFALGHEILSETTPSEEEVSDQAGRLTEIALVLYKTPHDNLLTYLPMVFNFVFSLLSRISNLTDVHDRRKRISSALLTVLLSLVRGASAVDKEFVRQNGVLSTYVQNYFNDAGTEDGAPMYRVLPGLVRDMFHSMEDPNNLASSSNRGVFKLLSDDLKSQKLRKKGRSGSSLWGSSKRSSITSEESKSSQEDSLLAEEFRSLCSKMSLKFSWFLFDVVIKSLTLQSKDGGSADRDEQANGWTFDEAQQTHLDNFFQNMKDLIHIITRAILRYTNSSNTKDNGIGRFGNRQLALFLRDLIPILKREDYASLLEMYIEGTKSNDIKTLRLKIEFFQILVDYRDFVAANRPMLEASNSIARQFFGTIKEALTRPENHVDQKAVKLLMQHLKKLDYDSRFQEDRRKAIAAEVYLPLVGNLMAMANFDTLTILQDEAMLQDISMAMLWILRNVDESALTAWWNKQHTDTVLRTFHFFERAIISISISEGISQLTKTHFMLNLLHVMDMLVIHLRPLIDDIRSGNVMMERLSPDVQLRMTIGDGELEAHVDSIVDAACQFFHSLILCSHHHEKHLRDILFNGTLRHFIELFIGDIIVKREGAVSRVQLRKDERKWRLLVGAVFAFVKHPSTDADLPTLNCLKLLTQPLFKPEEHNIVVNPNADDLIRDAKGDIRAAGLDNLIERLIVGANEEGHEFKKCFLHTYYSFTKPPELIRRLVGYYQMLKMDEEKAKEKAAKKDGEEDGEKMSDDADKKEEEDETQIRAKMLKLLNFLGDWIKKSSHDFTNDAVAALMNFLGGEELAREFAGAHAKLKGYLLIELLDIKIQNVDNTGMNMPTPEVPADFNIEEMAQPKIPLEHFASPMFNKRLLSSNPFDYPFNLLDWSPVEIARQMTLIESRLFKRIEPRECFGLAWSKKDKHFLAPNIVAISERFNKVNQWVQRTILLERDLRRRQALLVRFFEIAKELRKLNNFVSVNQICSAINSAAVHRMAKTLDALKSDMKKFEELSSLFASPPYSKLRKEQDAALSGKMVPFIGVFLTDLTFIEDGNADYVPHPVKGDEVRLINFAKRRLYWGQIQNIQMCQNVSHFNFVELPYLQYILQEEISRDSMDDRQLYQLSLQREPRQKK